jgi:hypothetical protein
VPSSRIDILTTSRPGRNLDGTMWLKWIVAAIGIVIGGWMTFDGSRAFLKGDYVTPSEGPYAGQLGPWANLVRGAGLEPRSSPMKTIFVVLGVSWLAATLGHLAGARWSWPALVALSILSIWYLPVGTVLAVIQLVLLFLLRSRT